MYSKIGINVLFLFLVVLFQLSFINNLPWGFSKLNLILIVLIFILGLVNFNITLWWALGAGFLLDIYSFEFFGVYLIVVLSTIIIANFLLVNFFTNRSLYSFLILSFLSLLIYEFFLQFAFLITDIFYHQHAFGVFKTDFWINILQAEIYNLFLVIFIFYIANFITQKLKPVFLIKKNEK